MTNLELTSYPDDEALEQTPEASTPHSTAKRVRHTNRPEAAPISDLPLNDPSLYLNRELSWLAFNERVFEEAQNPNTPLLERIKFIAIGHSNLDEYYMIRVSGLQQQLAASMRDLSPSVSLQPNN